MAALYYQFTIQDLETNQEDSGPGFTRPPFKTVLTLYTPAPGTWLNGIVIFQTITENSFLKKKQIKIMLF